MFVVAVDARCGFVLLWVRAYVYLPFCDALCCCDFVNSALAVGMMMSSSVAPAGSVSSVVWLLSIISISLRSVSRKSFSELLALGFALNIVRRSSTGSFFSSVGIKRLPYESVCTSSVSRARMLVSQLIFERDSM